MSTIINGKRVGPTGFGLMGEQLSYALQDLWGSFIIVADLTSPEASHGALVLLLTMKPRK